MDTFFSAYDRWHGLIPLVGGVYATLLAYGFLPRKSKDREQLELWQKKFGPMMRILGPFVTIMGFVTLALALSK